MGHKAWAENLEKVVGLCLEKNIEYVTFWWLSTENLKKRWAQEVWEIIKIINAARKFLKGSIKKWVKIKFIWNLGQLPEESQLILSNLEEETKNGENITVILALVHWGQDQIINGIKKFIESWSDINTLTQESFLEYIDSWEYPPADLIVRSGWDNRHSWFLLYQSAYSEYYFTDTTWPDFKKDEFQKALNSYNSSKRNFWK